MKSLIQRWYFGTSNRGFLHAQSESENKISNEKIAELLDTELDNGL